ncbi:hypothetical protein SUGI_0007620 [Cryptomeria japonica]|nr:hypothetical protein SUGI_0007620 [Cryptomeria japonica]
MSTRKCVAQISKAPSKPDDSAGDRTQNLWFRRPAPYPLGHRVTLLPSFTACVPFLLFTLFLFSLLKIFHLNTRLHLTACPVICIEFGLGFPYVLLGLTKEKLELSKRIKRRLPYFPQWLPRFEPGTFGV